MTYANKLGPVGVSLVGWALAWGAGPARGDDKKGGKDLEQLQGTWVKVVAERDGEEYGRTTPANLQFSFEFKDDTFTLHVGKDVGAKGTIKLDPAAKPKTIDLVYGEGPDKSLVGKVRLGIYELDGDNLRLCLTDLYTDVPRPKEFKTKKGDKFMVWTLKRQK